MATEAMSEECWASVPGFEGVYEVSTHGRVRSIDRRIAHAGSGTQFVRGRLMCAGLDTKGYPRLTLRNGDRKEWWAVHRLVLSVFLPRPDWREKHVNHIDGIRTNNRLSNLEWCTPAENTMHAYKVIKTLKPPAPRFGSAHANAQPVVGKCIATGEVRHFPSMAETRAAGFNPSDVSACCIGDQRSHAGWLWRHDDGEVPVDWRYEPISNAGAKHPLAKAVERVSPSGEVVRYACGKDAIADGFNNVSISHCITGRQRAHRGFTWRLANA